MLLYNRVHPHSAIGNQAPAMLHRLADNPGQAAVPMKLNFPAQVVQGQGQVQMTSDLGQPAVQDRGQVQRRSASTQIWRNFSGSGHRLDVYATIQRLTAGGHCRFAGPGYCFGVRSPWQWTLVLLYPSSADHCANRHSAAGTRFSSVYNLYRIPTGGRAITLL